jgi:hypothetical protein
MVDATAQMIMWVLGGLWGLGTIVSGYLLRRTTSLEQQVQQAAAQHREAWGREAEKLWRELTEQRRDMQSLVTKEDIRELRADINRLREQLMPAMRHAGE